MFSETKDTEMSSAWLYIRKANRNGKQVWSSLTKRQATTTDRCVGEFPSQGVVVTSIKA